MRLPVWAFTLCVSLWSPGIANACSVSPGPATQIELIMAREDLRIVKGKLTIQGNALRATEDGLEGPIYGRLETKRGTSWEVFSDYSQVYVDCAYFFAPTNDAEGSFWISRRKVDGRYQILLWEGEYLPVTEASETSKSDTTQ